MAPPYYNTRSDQQVRKWLFQTDSSQPPAYISTVQRSPSSPTLTPNLSSDYVVQKMVLQPVHVAPIVTSVTSIPANVQQISPTVTRVLTFPVNDQKTLASVSSVLLRFQVSQLC